MSKRKYAHIKEIEMQIISMREEGMTRQEIADELGLEKEQIKNWVARYNRRRADLLQGLPTKPKGTPTATAERTISPAWCRAMVPVPRASLI